MVAVKGQALYRFGVRLVETAHRVNDARELSDWVGQLIGAMKGELNSGIGSQIQSLTASAVTSGVGALYNLWSTERDELATLKGAEERATLDTYKAQDQAARQAEFKAAVEDMYQLIDKQWKKAEMTPEEVARYEGYMNDPELKALRPQIEVDLRNADAEQLTSTRIAEEKAAAQRDAGPNKSKHRDPEHMDATSRCPAVASAAPGGVDTLSAAEVLEGLANYFNTPEVKEVLSEAERMNYSAASDRVSEKIDLFRGYF